MKLIPLTKGKFAKVDDEDYEYLVQWKWCFINNRGGGHAVRQIGTNKKSVHQSMHRQLLGNPDGMVDHHNIDGLDNRRSNLRFATHQQNQQNQKKRIDNTSGFKGVSFHKLRNKWKAQINVNKKVTYIGLFDTAHHAAIAYDLWAKDVYGEFAQTNFQIKEDYS